jgi:hypothetical protein
VLVALRLEEGRGTRLEPLLHVETVAAHATVALARAAQPQLAWWTAAGIVHPGLFGALWIWQLAMARYKDRKVVEQLLETQLSRGSFDPRFFPPFQISEHAASIFARLDFGNGWPEILYGGAESCSALGAREASAWSLLFDRRKRLHGHNASPMRTDSLVADVVADVVASDADVDVLRTQRDLVLARVNDLPVDSPLREDLAQNSAGSQNSPRARRVATPNRVIETANLSNGDVEWSCVRSQDQGPMMGIRWVTYHRSAWGRGVYSNGRHVNPASHLAAEAARKAILDAEGPLLDQLQDAIPSWVKGSLVATGAFLAAWFYLCAALEASPLGFESGPMNVIRVAVALGLGFGWWRKRKSIRNPAPKELWESNELSWEAAKTRRIEKIKARISKLFRNFDYAPLMPVSCSFGAIKNADRLDLERAAFAVACQDRLIQNAIVEVAERNGIDMSEFKEGLQQINNYGVIASNIHGPVAAGDSASAHQTNDPTNTPPKPNKPSILKQRSAQSGAM